MNQERIIIAIEYRELMRNRVQHLLPMKACSLLNFTFITKLMLCYTVCECCSCCVLCVYVYINGMHEY